SLMLKYVRPGQVMLEGGCGQGQYVAFHAARGVRVVGLDFERECLAQLKKQRFGLSLCAGDVARVPLGDSTVDVYYSGGVVEHFEEGPEVPLLEARRVLRDRGVFLVSVPYLSPVRRVLAWLGRPHWYFVSDTRKTACPPDFTFFQYAFTRAEFRRLLENAGFEVVSTQGYAILWGLAELPGFDWLIRRLQRPRAPDSSPAASPAGLPRRVEDSPAPATPSLAKRLLVTEDTTVPLAGAFVRLLCWAAANMMMYTCVRRRTSPSKAQPPVDP